MARKVAIVTGAAGGIGRLLSRALASTGWFVTLADLDELGLRNTYESCIKGNSQYIITDVSKPDSVVNLFSAVVREHGRLDLLVNNAGIFGPTDTDFDVLAVEDWQKVVDVNLTGVFLCTREAFRVMKEQTPIGGRIINNASISAQVPRPNSVAYTATKHGVAGITKSAALDGRRFNIACGQIDVGNAATEMSARVADGVLQADGSLRPEPTFPARHVIEAFLLMANLPLDANVLHLTVIATGMPFVGRG